MHRCPTIVKFLSRFKEIALFLNKSDIFDIEAFKLIEDCRYTNTCLYII